MCLSCSGFNVIDMDTVKKFKFYGVIRLLRFNARNPGLKKSPKLRKEQIIGSTKTNLNIYKCKFKACYPERNAAELDLHMRTRNIIYNGNKDKCFICKMEGH